MSQALTSNKPKPPIFRTIARLDRIKVTTPEQKLEDGLRIIYNQAMHINSIRVAAPVEFDECICLRQSLTKYNPRKTANERCASLVDLYHTFEQRVAPYDRQGVVGLGLKNVHGMPVVEVQVHGKPYVPGQRI